MNDDALSESALRWRGVVRASLSSGIWLMIVLQIVVQLSGHGVQSAQSADAFARVLLGSVGVVAMLYLQAGIFAALVRTRDPVSVAEVLRAGRDSFLPFIWLMIRAALLFAAMAVLAGLVVSLSVGAEDPRAIAEPLAPLFVAATVLLPFVLVYWLPLVFVQRDFRLLVTLKAALGLLWHRRAQGWYLALLILVPAIATGLLPAATPFAVRLVLGALIMLLAWSANTYCIEWLVARREPRADVS